MGMIERDARLYRAGVTGSGSRVSLGSIESLRERRFVESLDLNRINSYDLSPLPEEDDLLVCEVYLQADGSAAAVPKAQTAALQAVINQKEEPSSQQQPKPTRDHATAAKKVDRLPAPARSSWLKDMDELTSFLYELLGGPTKPWPKAERAHDVLKRRKAVVEALNTLKDLGWSRSCGGYEIPEDFESADDLAGITFTREKVYEAFLLKNSIANQDAALFKDEHLERLPSLRTWYNNPEGEQSSKLRSMTVSVFKAWKDRALKAKSSEKKREVREQKSEGEGKGKRRRSDSSDDDEHGKISGKKGRRQESGGKQAEKFYSSDYLDEPAQAGEDDDFD